MSSGLTRTEPLPIVSAASGPLSLPGLFIRPGKLGSGSVHAGPPMPKFSAALVSWREVRTSDSPTNAVLHACANTSRKVGRGPRLGSTGTLENSWPAELRLEHSTVLLALTALAASSAAVETMVKDWPGWYRPSSGLTASVPAALCLATARIPPLPALTAMIAAEGPAPASAFLAAC